MCDSQLARLVESFEYKGYLSSISSGISLMPVLQKVICFVKQTTSWSAGAYYYLEGYKQQTAAVDASGANTYNNLINKPALPTTPVTQLYCCDCHNTKTVSGTLYSRLDSKLTGYSCQ